MTPQQRCDKQRQRLIHKEAERIWRLMEPHHKGRRLPTINIRRGRDIGRMRGFAQSSWNMITISVDPHLDEYDCKSLWSLLAHELAHCAQPPKQGNGDKNRNVHHRDFYHCLRDVWRKRWKCRISFHEVSTWGYSVDHLIDAQGFPYVTWKLPNPTTPIRNTEPTTTQKDNHHAVS